MGGQGERGEGETMGGSHSREGGGLELSAVAAWKPHGAPASSDALLPLPLLAQFGLQARVLVRCDSRWPVCQPQAFFAIAKTAQCGIRYDDRRQPWGGLRRSVCEGGGGATVKLALKKA